MKTFLNRTLIIVTVPTMMVSEIIGNLYKGVKNMYVEFIKIEKDPWDSSSVVPRTLEEKKADLIVKLLRS